MSGVRLPAQLSLLSATILKSFDTENLAQFNAAFLHLKPLVKLLCQPIIVGHLLSQFVISKS